MVHKLVERDALSDTAVIRLLYRAPADLGVREDVRSTTEIEQHLSGRSGMPYFFLNSAARMFAGNSQNKEGTLPIGVADAPHSCTMPPLARFVSLQRCR